MEWKRGFIFCHESNYSGSVGQDRQALRKMYGPPALVLVFREITRYFLLNKINKNQANLCQILILEQYFSLHVATVAKGL